MEENADHQKLDDKSTNSDIDEQINQTIEILDSFINPKQIKLNVHMSNDIHTIYDQMKSMTREEIILFISTIGKKYSLSQHNFVIVSDSKRIIQCNELKTKLKELKTNT